MATITKKELIDRIADTTQDRRVLVKRVVQKFLDEIIGELGRGNRLEFRDFGVFETKIRKARKAQGKIWGRKLYSVQKTICDSVSTSDIAGQTDTTL